MSAREALLSVEGVLRRLGDSKALGSFYLEFGRRLEVLKLVERYCRRGSLVLDLGAQPFIVPRALRRMGYEVVAFDVEPEPYVGVAESCGARVNDLTFIDAEPEDCLRVSGCFDLVRLLVRRPSGLNALRLLAYPLARLRPGLRQLIVVVGVKVGEPKPEAVERWG